MSDLQKKYNDFIKEITTNNVDYNFLYNLNHNIEFKFRDLYKSYIYDEIKKKYPEVRIIHFNSVNEYTNNKFDIVIPINDDLVRFYTFSVMRIDSQIECLNTITIDRNIYELYTTNFIMYEDLKKYVVSESTLSSSNNVELLLKKIDKDLKSVKKLNNITHRLVITTYSNHSIISAYYGSYYYKIMELYDLKGNLLYKCANNKINRHLNILVIKYDKYINPLYKNEYEKLKNLDIVKSYLNVLKKFNLKKENVIIDNLIN
jgi:hypothetical protein